MQVTRNEIRFRYTAVQREHYFIACTTRSTLLGLISPPLSMLSVVNGYADLMTFGEFYESLSPD